MSSIKALHNVTAIIKLDVLLMNVVKFWKKNNTADSNVVPDRSTNAARSCLTSLSRREAV